MSPGFDRWDPGSGIGSYHIFFCVFCLAGFQFVHKKGQQNLLQDHNIFYNMAQQLWLVSIPNRGDGANASISALTSAVVNPGLAKFHKFEIPNLVVGTLDSLVALSDDLNKLNGQVEV